MTIRVGLVGYGAGGRYFHAPFLQASTECILVGVVTRSAPTARLVALEAPSAVVYSSLRRLLDDGVDVVVISTPPETHRELVLEALGRGVHVVADKPFAPDVATAQELIDAARDAGVILSVFHNRRWDTDIVTLQALLARGQLGQVRRFDSRFDLDHAESVEPGPSGGLLRDLGSHVVDQAVFLFGPARYVTAQLDWVELLGGRTDGGFVVSIVHASGVHSHVSATKLNRLKSKELRVMGAGGSYVSNYTDVQAQAIFAGKRPAVNRARWGYEAKEHWGEIRTAEGSSRVPSEQGDYTTFYDQLAAAIKTGSLPPVPANEALETLRVLDAARRSDAEHKTINMMARR